MDDDYEIDISDIPCGRCGHLPLHFRHCNAPCCEDGWIDEFEDDPINFVFGEERVPCEECFEGIQRWCPKCVWSWDDAQKSRRKRDGRDDEN